MHTHLERLKKECKPYRDLVISHSLYKQLKTKEQVQTLMENHVFAVWDFMSLLKGLQKEFTSVSVPWIPTSNPELRRFINEIVLEEESDKDLNGDYKSHLEMYLDAMDDLKADTKPFFEFLNSIQSLGLEKSINNISDVLVKDFVRYTFKVLQSGKSHCIASAFTFGREDLIPDMFHVLVNELHEVDPNSLKNLKYYLDRHIELDGDSHGPLSEKMMFILCGEDEIKWKEATETAVECLKHRANLWTSVEQKINNLVPEN